MNMNMTIVKVDVVRCGLDHNISDLRKVDRMYFQYGVASCQHGQYRHAEETDRQGENVFLLRLVACAKSEHIVFNKKRLPI